MSQDSLLIFKSKMSWFNTFNLSNISTIDHYYFIPEVYAKNFFCINYAESVKVDEREICMPKRGINIIAVPKQIISRLIPAKDFNITVIASFKGKTYNFTRVPLETILTNETIKYPQYLTHAILSCGERSIDFGQEILVIPGMIVIPKFTDLKVIEKLNEALNRALWNPSRYSRFTLEDEKSGFHISVTIQPSDNVVKNFRENIIGPFLLPELTEVTKVSNSPDLLIKSMVMDQAAQVNSESDSE